MKSRAWVNGCLTKQRHRFPPLLGRTSAKSPGNECLAARSAEVVRVTYVLACSLVASKISSSIRAGV